MNNQVTTIRDPKGVVQDFEVEKDLPPVSWAWFHSCGYFCVGCIELQPMTKSEVLQAHQYYHRGAPLPYSARS